MPMKCLHNWLIDDQNKPLNEYLNISSEEAVLILVKLIKEEPLWGSNIYDKLRIVREAEEAEIKLNIISEKIKNIKENNLLYTYCYKDDLSVRLYNILMKNGIFVLNDLENTSRKDLYKIKGFATKSFNELKEFLQKHKIYIS